MSDHPIINLLMSMLARIPKVVFIVLLAVLYVLSTQVKQADAFRYWGVFNALISLVAISKSVIDGWYEIRQMIWHVVGHGMFLAGVVYAMGSPEFTVYELFVFFLSSGLLLAQFRSIRWHEAEFRKDLH
jgi:hypothetical protein